MSLPQRKLNYTMDLKNFFSICVLQDQYYPLLFKEKQSSQY